MLAQANQLPGGPGSNNLFIRSRLMIEIREYMQENNLTQKQASIKTGVTQPRISDFMRGKIDLFTIDTLVPCWKNWGLTSM